MSADKLAAAAENLVGARFRLHGRDPATGLDCIGVLAQSLLAIGRSTVLPDDYRLRARRVQNLAQIAEACGFRRADGPLSPGDVLLSRIGPVQHHLLIASRDGRLVHAHAGLRRVVIGELGEGWSIVSHWRLAPKSEG